MPCTRLLVSQVLADRVHDDVIPDVEELWERLGRPRAHGGVRVFQAGGQDEGGAVVLRLRGSGLAQQGLQSRPSHVNIRMPQLLSHCLQHLRPFGHRRQRHPGRSPDTVLLVFHHSPQHSLGPRAARREHARQCQYDDLPDESRAIVGASQQGLQAPLAAPSPHGHDRGQGALPGVASGALAADVLQHLVNRQHHSHHHVALGIAEAQQLGCVVGHHLQGSSSTANDQLLAERGNVEDLGRPLLQTRDRHIRGRLDDLHAASIRRRPGRAPQLHDQRLRRPARRHSTRQLRDRRRGDVLARRGGA
mmetsp:Transcript_105640/g.268335  ORF Transcript_105640/g.268335 Transcript_105640/m.268335 type:complete len:305 (+) Transcript_105640:1159-2073(+)